jgi:hypothetical protein
MTKSVALYIAFIYMIQDKLLGRGGVELNSPVRQSFPFAWSGRGDAWRGGR